MSTDITILIDLVLQFHVMMLFSENITESQKFGLFPKSWKIFFSVVVNNKLPTLLSSLVCCVGKYEHFKAYSHHLTCTGCLSDWLLKRQMILWLLVMLYSDLKQWNIWGLKYYFVKILPDKYLTENSFFRRRDILFVWFWIVVHKQ